MAGSRHALEAAGRVHPRYFGRGATVEISLAFALRQAGAFIVGDATFISTARRVYDPVTLPTIRSSQARRL